MKRIFGMLLIILSVAINATPAFAYTSTICKDGDRCLASEVGPFMKGITNGCGNAGDCSLDDILLVFTNVGNYVVGIVGGVVLLMYIMGGFWILTARGDTGQVTKGKKYITISTLGLLIVMVAYLGITTLVSVITKPTGVTGPSAETSDNKTFVNNCAVVVEKGICVDSSESSNYEGQCMIGVCSKENEICCPGK